MWIAKIRLISKKLKPAKSVRRFHTRKHNVECDNYKVFSVQKLLNFYSKVQASRNVLHTHTTFKLFKNPNRVENLRIKTQESQGFSISDTLKCWKNQEHQNGGFKMAAVLNS